MSTNQQEKYKNLCDLIITFRKSILSNESYRKDVYIFFNEDSSVINDNNLKILDLFKDLKLKDLYTAEHIHKYLKTGNFYCKNIIKTPETEIGIHYGLETSLHYLFYSKLTDHINDFISKLDTLEQGYSNPRNSDENLDIDLSYFQDFFQTLLKENIILISIIRLLNYNGYILFNGSNIIIDTNGIKRLLKASKDHDFSKVNF